MASFFDPNEEIEPLQIEEFDGSSLRELSVNANLAGGVIDESAGRSAVSAVSRTPPKTKVSGTNGNLAKSPKKPKEKSQDVVIIDEKDHVDKEEQTREHPPKKASLVSKRTTSVRNESSSRTAESQLTRPIRACIQIEAQVRTDIWEAVGNHENVDHYLRKISSNISLEQAFAKTPHLIHHAVDCRLCKGISFEQILKLTDPCTCGHLETVKILMKRDENVFFHKDNCDNTPLHRAAACGLLDVIDYALDAGHAEVDAVNKFNETPLFQACSMAHTSAQNVVIKLLSAGANPDIISTKDSHTPLTRACEVGSVTTVKACLEKSKHFRDSNTGEINVKNEDGFLLLWAACAAAHFTSAAEYLVELGAPFKFGRRSVLDQAMKLQKIVRIENDDASSSEIVGEVVYPRQRIIDAIRARYPEAEAEFEERRSAEESALLKWKVSEEQRLANIRTASKNKRVRYSIPEGSVMLDEEGKPISQLESVPKKAKKIASKVVAESVDQTAELPKSIRPTRSSKYRKPINMKESSNTIANNDGRVDNDHFTFNAPDITNAGLELSEESRELHEMLLRLIEEEEDTKESMDATTKAFKDIVSNKKIPFWAAYVNDLGETALHKAAYTGNYQILYHLLHDYAADSDAVNLEGDTPLHYACYGGMPGTAHYLLKLGQCNVNAKNNEGETALHIAARDGKSDCARVLIKIGSASVNSQDGEGWAPMHYVCNIGTPGHIEILNMLLQLGPLCTRDIKTNEGYTPWSKNVHPEAAKALADITRIEEDQRERAKAMERRKNDAYNASLLEETDSSSDSNDDGEWGKNKIHRESQEKGPVEPPKQKYPPPLDLDEEHKNLAIVREQIHKNFQLKQTPHMLRFEEIIAQKIHHPSTFEKDSQLWHRAYLLQQIKRLRSLACGTAEDVCLLRQVEEMSILKTRLPAGTDTAGWESYLVNDKGPKGQLYYTFDKEVHRPEVLPGCAGKLPKGVETEWYFGVEHEKKTTYKEDSKVREDTIREQLMRFYCTEGSLHPGMNPEKTGKNAAPREECNAFWAKKLGAQAFSIILRDNSNGSSERNETNGKVRGAMTGFIAWTTKDDPVLYIEFVRCDNSFSGSGMKNHGKTMQSGKSIFNKSKHIFPSQYLMNQLHTYAQSLMEPKKHQDKCAHILTQSVGLQYTSKKESSENPCPEITRKNNNHSNMEPGRKYWRRHLEENAYADFFGAQMILISTGLKGAHFVEEENAFMHKFVYPSNVANHAAEASNKVPVLAAGGSSLPAATVQPKMSKKQQNLEFPRRVTIGTNEFNGNHYASTTFTNKRPKQIDTERAESSINGKVTDINSQIAVSEVGTPMDVVDVEKEEKAEPFTSLLSIPTEAAIAKMSWSELSTTAHRCGIPVENYPYIYPKKGDLSTANRLELLKSELLEKIRRAASA